MTRPDSKRFKKYRRLFKKSDINVEKFVKAFTSEMGKRTAVIFFIVTFFLLGGSVIPPELVLQFYVGMIFFVNGLIVFFLINRSNKKTDKAVDEKQSQIDEITVRMDDTEKKSESSVMKLVGRIKALERYNPNAVFEMDLASGQIFHVNELFRKITGYTKEEINQIINQMPDEFKPMALVKIFVQEDHWADVQQMFNDRFAGEDIPTDQLLYNRRKNGTPYPARIQVRVVYEDGHRIMQGSISDETDMVDMRNSIEMRDGYIEQLLDTFTSAYNRYQKTEALIEEIHRVKKMYYDEAQIEVTQQ